MKSFKNIMLECGGDKLEDLENDLQLLRLGMEEELKATTLYENIVEKAKDKRVKELFKSVLKEEKVHTEEFRNLIMELDKGEYGEVIRQAENEKK